MLRAVKEFGLDKEIETQVSLEEKMACGVGACLACVCQSKEVDDHSHVHNKRVCKDGPVFDAREVEI
jgi:dihydroorotate dehydrogenase electron transfer subunit